MRLYVHTATSGSAWSSDRSEPVEPINPEADKKQWRSEWRLVAAINTEKGVVWYWEKESE